MQQFSIEKILGYPITTDPIDIVIAQICSWITGREQRKFFICANPHSLVVADTDLDFHQVLHSADLVTPDGAGIILASKILGGNIRKRITGSDVFDHLSSRLNISGGARYFFLGSTDETLMSIKSKMAIQYPLIEVESYSPPYKSEFNDNDNHLMVEVINAARPDVLWVGMTAPKQEKWIFKNKDKINTKFIGAIGAVFDFYAGNIKRSHPYFQKIGLEWLPRLVQEPRRLWRRNFISNPIFLTKVIKQRLKT